MQEQIPQWILELDIEDLTFIKNFILCSGSLKEMEKVYDVSYPTVRLRLNKLIQKIQINDKKEEEPFIKYIKGLALDERLDVETAKDILDKYKKERRNER